MLRSLERVDEAVEELKNLLTSCQQNLGPNHLLTSEVHELLKTLISEDPG